MKAQEIWAIILAAGESVRMNGPKLILPFGKTTILGSVIESIEKSEIEQIMVVLGSWKKEIESVIMDYSVNSCYNKEFKSGMLSSVICGLGALPVNTEAAMIFPGDQPGISPAVITSMLRAMNEKENGIIIAVHNGRRGHPILIRKKLFKEVGKLNKNIGLRELLSKFQDEICEVVTDEKEILHDIDTLEDYNMALINKTRYDSKA